MPGPSTSQSASVVPQVEARYSSEAIETILSHALELQSSETYSLEQLKAMAAELNIAPEALTVAEQHWQCYQAETAHEAEAAMNRRRYLRQQWMQYGFGSLLMVGIDIATAGAVTWSIFPVLGWGLGVIWDGCDRSQTNNSTVKSHG